MDSARYLCLDTDALVHLLALSYFDAALKYIGSDRAHCYRLHAADRQIRKARWIEEQWRFFDREAAEKVVRELRPLQASPSLDLLEALNIDGIDGGEALLLAALVDHPELLLLSGDRRMLASLHASTDRRVVQVREAVRGRVVLFTQVIGALAREFGVGNLEDRVRRALCRHKTLKIMFGSHRPTNPKDFWEAYDSEMRSCLDVCGDGWLFPLTDTIPPRPDSSAGDLRTLGT